MDARADFSCPARALMRCLFLGLLALARGPVEGIGRDLCKTEKMHRNDDHRPKWPTIVVVSYNVENLFSPWVDSLNPDTTFTPRGEKHWTPRLLRIKIVRIADAIASVDAVRAPAIVGLCEVEDASVLRRLTRDTYLSAVNYRFYHRDSPDPRGIDVAVLYDTAQLVALGCRWLSPTLPDGSPWKSREILYARFRLPNGDTLHLFQNHWPSKYTGAEVSSAKREVALNALMASVDSITALQPHAKIIAMGDFNEEANAALFDAMGRTNVAEARKSGRLVNLFHPARRAKGLPGSHKYRGLWAMIDNFFVSPSLLEGEGYCVDTVVVHTNRLLLERDATHGGVRPRRAFLGPRYRPEGTSDHLPIVLRLKIPTFAPKEKGKE